MSKADSRLIRLTETFFVWLSGITLMGMMFLTFADVIGRYFLSSPLLGAFELTELMFAVTVFSALPAVTLNNKHIAIDVLDSVMPKWSLVVQVWVAQLITIAMLVLISVAVGRQAVRMSASGIHTEILHIPTHLIVFYVSALSMLAAITSAIRLVIAGAPVEETNHHG